MLKHIRIFLYFINNNLIREMEYRANFLFWLLVEFLYVGLSLFTINVYFGYAATIAGWSKPEVYLLLGVFRIIEGAYKIFFHLNINNFSETVSRGDLDIALTKPVDSLVMVTTRRHSLDEVATVLSGVGILTYLHLNRLVVLTPTSLAGIVLFSFTGIICLYSLMVTVSTLSVFLTRTKTVHTYWEVLSKSLRLPLDIYSRGNRLASYLLWPLVIVITLPAKIILGRSPIWLAIPTIAGSFALLLLTRSFWRFALRHYSSASS